MDRAKSLASLEAIAERRIALTSPHMQALVSFAERLRDTAPAGVPDFDPFDGGVEAERLFLLEAPGAKAISSGFISRNNPDETASNFFAVNVGAGLSRSRTITWNAVPWYIGLGDRFRESVEAATALASAHPKLGSPWKQRTRRVFPKGFPFSVVCHIEAAELVVFAVAHFKRRPTYWRSRR